LQGRVFGLRVSQGTLLPVIPAKAGIHDGGNMLVYEGRLRRGVGIHPDSISFYAFT
jgi:hypothetical protein